MATKFVFPDEDLEETVRESVNPYLSDPLKGLRLLTQLVAEASATSNNQRMHLERLHQLIHQGYVSLAARDSYPAEARSFRSLIDLEESLADLADFPALANKTVIGIGGGFSAGKSRFVNSLLENDLLPEGLKQTTAIPSYVVHGSMEKIFALNYHNHAVALDRDALNAITHAFPSHYREQYQLEIGFAQMLRLLIVHDPRLRWRHLAFLDTPGYNKPDRPDVALSDAQIALRQLAEADHVLWLLSARNGSIRRADLEFLRTLNHRRPIFFVVTQADLSDRSRIDSLLRTTRESLDKAGIEVVGLCAWAAPHGARRGKPIAGDDVCAWLQQLDDSPKLTRKRLECARLLDAQIAFNNNALLDNKRQLTTMNQLLLLVELENAAVAAAGHRELLGTQIDRLRREQRDLKSLIQQFGSLKQEMLDTITRLVGDIANDEEVWAGHELTQTMRCDWFKRPLEVGERLEVRVVAIKREDEKVKVSFGDDLASTALLFSRIRGALRIDPNVLVKGSLLQAEVRAVQHPNITLAITNPYASN